MSDVPPEVLALVERFQRNREDLESSDYNETQLRVEFVNPLWKALGWDVDNEAGYAMAYRDVVHEDAIRVGTAVKAPDYSFRIGGARKFFLETKRPAVNVREEPLAAFQLRRYGWSAKLPLSILTNFQDLVVYDCRFRPRQSDKASQARILAIGCGEYADRWPELESVFSREALLRGSFDEYVEAAGGKRGTAEVDVEFLKEIEEWRDILARHIALRNPQLDVRQLNLAVQMTLDRMVFLRMCEDRGIEPYGRLQSLCSGPRVYPRLVEIFTEADQRYNSGLFHFEPERDQDSAPDELTPRLALDDGVLQGILQRLYYPDCPYEFRILPPEILGNVYEQFLGKVIRLTAGHQARVEEKPEVRKAGGVHYTPQYIADYLVATAVAPLCEGKTPAEVARLRLADIACGSGSLLLAAYQSLLDWHLRFYLDDRERTGRIPTVPQEAGRKARRSDTPVMYEGRGGDWLLSTAEKRRILLNNIYGVDIDAQAVEVTKLSLLLKVLENENQDTLRRQLSLWRERALPDLSRNVRCGNSLIGPEFYRGEQLTMFGENDACRINAFDWHDERLGFGAVMAGGGFDAIIGNPPYIRIQAMKEWAPLEVEFYKGRYETARAGNYDLYVVFVEKALQLLNPQGRLGFILPHKFLNAQYGRPLRALIAGGRHLARVVHFGDAQVFSGATTYTCLMFLEKAGCPECVFDRVTDLAAWRDAIEQRGRKAGRSRMDRGPAGPPRVAESASEGYGTGEPMVMGACGGTPAPSGAAERRRIPARRIRSEVWDFPVGPGAKLQERLAALTPTLGDVADIYVGLQTSADDVFIMDLVRETKRDIRLRSKALGKDWAFEKELLHPLLSGTDVSRYAPLPARQYILFPYAIAGGRAALIAFDELSRRFPKTAAYLQENRERLRGRERGKFKDAAWHRFGRNQNLGIQSRIKLCVPRLVDGLCAAYDADGARFLDNVDVGGVTLKPEFEGQGLVYLLALLNSRLLRWFFPSVSAPFRGGWYSANRQFLSRVPIRLIDFSSAADTEKHGQIVTLVERLLHLHRRRLAVRTPDEKERLDREIAATDSHLDDLVYDLYGLTAEEIGLVEGSAGQAEG